MLLLKFWLAVFIIAVILSAGFAYISGKQIATTHILAIAFSITSLAVGALWGLGAWLGIN